MTTQDPTTAVDDLLARAARLERELLDLEGQLTSVGAGTTRAGLHMVVEAGGHRALIQARSVVQITRVVEFTPIPGAGEAVLGGFVRHGQPAVAVDLARLMGSPRELDLDAHLVIVGGARLLGILVDRVRHVIDAPARVDPRAERLLPSFRAELVSGWCDAGGWLLPVIEVEAIERLATCPEDLVANSRPPAGEGEGT